MGGSDVYVGLIGLRYGSPVRDQPRGVLYRAGVRYRDGEPGLPRLVFVLDENVAVPIPPARLLDADPGLQERQRAFRAKVADSGVVLGKFATPEQLEVLLLQALQETRPRAEAPPVAERGSWIPASPLYRLEGLADKPAALTVEQARAQPSRMLLARHEIVPFAGRRLPAAFVRVAASGRPSLGATCAWVRRSGQVPIGPALRA